MTDETRAWLARILAQASRDGFYGSVEVRFEGGRPTHAVLKESLKPPRREG